MKKIAVILTLVTLIFLCSCTTGYREINRGYLVTAIGITAQDEKLNIYIEAVSSSDVTDQPSQRVVLTGEGNNISSAYKNLNSSLVKSLYFEQLGTAILSADLSTDIYSEFFKFLKDFESISLGIYIVKTLDIKMLFEFESPNGVLGYDIIGLIKMREKQNGVKSSNRFYQIEPINLNLPLVNLENEKLVLNSLGE